MSNQSKAYNKVIFFKDIFMIRLMTVLALFLIVSCASRSKNPCAHLKSQENVMKCHDEAFIQLKIRPFESVATLKKLCEDFKLGRACSNVGNFLENPGSASLKNFSQAAEFYKIGCELNEGIACYNLANMLFMGKGMGPDEVRGLEYLKRSCDLDYNVACWRMGTLIAAGKLLPHDPLKIVAYLKKGCDLKDMMSCYDLGFYLMEGKGLEKNIEKGLELLKLSCEKGLVLGCGSLGFFYSTPNSYFPSDYSKALEHLTSACQEEAEACNHLGYMYETGKGVQKNISFAFQFYSKSCSMKKNYACGNLGILIATKEVPHLDDAAAVPYLEKGCAENNGKACKILALFHDQGRGQLPISKVTSLYFHKRGCQNGDNESCLVLSRGFKNLCRSQEELIIGCPAQQDQMSLCRKGRKLTYRFGNEKEIVTEYDGNVKFSFEDFLTKRVNELRFTLKDVNYKLREDIQQGDPIIRKVVINGNDESLDCEAPIMGSMDKLRKMKVFAPTKQE
jgi:TPR repeat protein